LWRSWEFARPEIVEKQVLLAENVKTAAAGAENTKIKGRVYNSSGIFF
jgi:hypothetical protein